MPTIAVMVAAARNNMGSTVRIQVLIEVTRTTYWNLLTAGPVLVQRPPSSKVYFSFRSVWDSAWSCS